MSGRRWPIGLACGYFVAAALTVWLTRFNGGIAFVWIASALLVSHLCLTPRSEWPRAVALCAAASWLATAFLGLGPVAAPLLSAANMAEAVVAALLIQRFIPKPGDFASIREVVRFTAIAGLVVPALGAPFGAAIASAVSSSHYVPNMVGWFTGHGLGLITILPVSLLVGRGEIGAWLRSTDGRGKAEAAILAIGMILVTLGVFVQTSLPLLFVPLLPALFATFRLGNIGAAASVLILVAVGAPCMIAGFGPLALIEQSMGFRTQFFQFYVAITFLTVLPAAAELRNRKRLFSALHESEARYRLLAENTTDLIIYSDLDTTRRYVSPAAKPLLGYEPEELVGTRPLDFVHPDDRENYGEVLRTLSEGRVERTVTRQRYRRRDGSWIWMDVSFSLAFDDETGKPTGYVASLRDVTDRYDAEEALRVSEERLALALDSGSDGLWDWNVVTGEVKLSDHWFSMLGYATGEIESHISTWQALAHPDDAEQARLLLNEHLAGRTPTYECEYRLKTRSGGYAWTLARGKVVSRAPDGRALRMVGTHIDVTKRKAADEQIAHMAMHDALTGLPNRAYFRQHLGAIAMRAGAEGRQFAVLACDLDRFKAVNDTRGHLAGDAVLRIVADRLKSAVREHDVVARLGGDEFAIVLRWIDSPDEASAIAQRVIASIGQPMNIDGQPAEVGVSVGIALGHGDPAEQIFKNADFALYEAKDEGRNDYRFFEQGMEVALVARSQLENDLQTALRDREFTLLYQPIVKLTTGRICAFEALMRWNHPKRGAISPNEFIPLVEASGLIVPLGGWALREACMTAAAWPDDVRIAVNVSAVQFQRPGLEQAVTDALEASGLKPERLELEITESVLIQNAIAVVSTLMRLRALGVRIALDDFGTGYSSLSYLRRFPFNKIKIDRSFVVEIADPDVAAIVRAIVGLGQRNGADVTAEGVETAEQLELVRDEGCTEGQGYLFNRPVDAARAAQILAQDGADRRAFAPARKLAAG